MEEPPENIADNFVLNSAESSDKVEMTPDKL
jgi:hypothetical protein